MDTSHSIELLQQLIAMNSVSSSSNAAISDFAANQLRSLGFHVERTEYVDTKGVTKVNLVARRNSANRNSANRNSANSDSARSDTKTQSTSGGLAYFCHTDVVPAREWTGPGGDPFCGVIQDERVYGRGSCDMKGSFVAMLQAAACVNRQEQNKPLWIVCTADEEVGFAGAEYLVENSAEFREIVQFQPVGIIGEPTQLSVVHAHKGITGFQVTSHGRAAHSSSRDGVNATVAMVPMLNTLLELLRRTESDTRYHDDRFDPPTLTWNFGVDGHNTAINVKPPRCDAWVSFRTMPGIDGEDLIQAAKTRANELGLDFQLYHGGSPVWVDPDASCIRTMCDLAGRSNSQTVCYATDGGKFTELKQLLVCGPGDIAQAHTTDEWISIDQLNRGADIYTKAIRKWCC